jgi:hypothetical protein
VSISGETVVVGAWGGDEGGERTGSIYVFEKPPSGWTNMTETAKLTASDVPAHAHLGWSVAISGDIVVGGAPATLFNGTGAGAAYVFRRPSRGWVAVTEEAKLTASNGTEDDEFGYAVAINDGVTMIGARRHNTGAYDNSGAAYAYHGQSDCQPNDALDLCDIVRGVSADANHNGAPDECGGARGGAVDSLSMARADGASITLSWSRSCQPTDDDYEIYEGALGEFASHTPLFCTTGGAMEQTFVPNPGGRYYLLVPRNAVVEGSYGLDSEDQERPQGPSVCLPRVLGVCP